MKNRQYIILATIFIGSFFVYMIYISVKANDKYLDIEFNGKVQNVRYDVKGFPYVTIKDKEFYLGVNTNFEYLIEKGDSVTKRKANSEIILIKQNKMRFHFN